MGKSRISRRNAFGRSCFMPLVLLGLSLATFSRAAELMVFPQITVGAGRYSEGTRYQRESEWGADLFYTDDFGPFRVLGEYLLTNHEAELERFQLGWKFGGETTLWLGRFHAPLGYWNTEFHHGEFLQTSISHPAIESYEDQSGVVPAHVAGLLFDHKHEIEGGAAWRALFSVGQGPRLEADGLAPWDLFHARRGGGRAIAARLSYYPDAFGETEFGVFFGGSVIPIVLPDFRENRQQVAGVFANVEQGRWRTVAAVFHVRDRVTSDLAARSGASFFNGYGQIEYAFNTLTALYGRAEMTAGGKNDAYLNLSPEFVRHRLLAGVRRALTAHQAVKLEVAASRMQDERRVAQIQVQWSMVFP